MNVRGGQWEGSMEKLRRKRRGTKGGRGWKYTISIKDRK
jgi:hypothetical protein